MQAAELWKKLKTYLITGALVMVPLFISVYVVVVIVTFVARHAGFGHGMISDIIGIFIALTLVFIAGFITQHAIGTKVMDWLAGILKKIPIAGTLYTATKQIMEALMQKKSLAFRKAVLIEYPRKGIYSVAFVTKDRHKSPYIPDEEAMVHVFLPTTPNPTSGYFLIVPQSSIIPLGIPVEEAFKLIISGGIVSYDANNETRRND
ncbi:MAG TPA: DUF502 domain-containing protein [Deltaproteobacteria bacterium]|nr:DUF502 domain-containing protein [Deltaproteobacteria bacterium]